MSVSHLLTAVARALEEGARVCGRVLRRREEVVGEHEVVWSQRRTSVIEKM